MKEIQPGFNGDEFERFEIADLFSLSCTEGEGPSLRPDQQREEIKRLKGRQT